MSRPMFIFGGDTGVSSPEQLKRLRAIAEALNGPSQAPRDVGEGLHAIGQALAGRITASKANRMAAAGEESRAKTMNPIIAALTGNMGAPASSAVETGSGSNAVAQALSGAPASQTSGNSALPASFLEAVDQTEGAGGYDTLYGHAQRSGPFAGTDVSSMTVRDAMAFAAPSGAYGQHVKGQIGRIATPMGRHQIVGTTLRRASDALGIDPSTPFNRQTQDQIAAHLAQQRIASANTMDGKIAALRAEWHGFRSIPTAQMVQIVNDLENAPRNAVAANEAMAAREPVQVASLDPAADLSQNLRGVPAPAGLETERLPGSPMPPNASNLVVPAQRGYRSGDPAATTPAGQRVVQQMLNPQAMTGGAPMAFQPQGSQAAQVQTAQASGGFPMEEMAGRNPQFIPAQQPQGGPSIAQLYQALQDPWINEGDKAIIASEIERQQKLADPMTQMSREKARLEIERLRNPQTADWSRLDDGRLFNQRTGEVRDVGTAGAAGPTDLGLNPQYGLDAEGNPVLLQLGKDGRVVQSQMPEGVTLSKEPIRLDAGTHFVLLDPITRQPIGQIPKDLAGAERGKAVGKAEGEAFAAASSDLQSSQNALDLIASIRDDPNRERGTGFSSNFNWIPGTGGFDFQRKVNQATSGAFLSAIQQLRGMGALSNAEGQTATQAVTRLDTASSEEEFLNALADYERIVLQGRDKAAARLAAGANGGGEVPTLLPAITVPAGVDPEDWEVMTPEERALFQ